jgi:hypothetical protein
MKDNDPVRSHNVIGLEKKESARKVLLAFFSLITGQFAYYMLIEPFMNMSVSIGSKLPIDLNYNVDDYLLALHPICVIPTIVINILLGLFFRKKRLFGSEILSTAIGSIIGSLITLSLLTTLFIWTWSKK